MLRLTPLAIALAALLLPASAGAAPRWLAADMHVHSCYSHDSYCGPGDDNTGPDTFFSSGGSVANRFTEAAAKDLDALHIADHNDVRAQTDPAFGSAGVLGLRGYEHSLAGGGGHAHLFGARGVLPAGPDKPRADAAAHTASIASAVEQAGGVFQANHPTYRGRAAFTRCEQAELAAWDTSPLHWKQGFGIPPTTVEVWNPTTLIEPAETFWECLLQRGRRVAGTAGSDSHGTNQANLGRPLTWVLAEDATEAAVFAAMRAGRTTLARDRAVRLLLEADADRNGSFESLVGDVVPPGTPMRVRADGNPAAGVVDVRANGRDLLADARLEPGGELRFKAPDEAPGWVRATLRLPAPASPFDPNCAPSGQGISACSADQATAAMTSPVYLASRPAEAPDATRPPAPPPAPGPPPSGEDDVPDPDEQRPLPPGQASGDGRLPDAPRPAGSRPAVAPRPLRLRLRRTGRRGGRVYFGVRASAPAGTRLDLEVRRGGRSRLLVRAGRPGRTYAFSARRGERLRVRARVRGAGGRPGPWQVAVRARRA